jgi:alpha-beta hydrolase superfamily lysophospholipase
MFFGSPAAPLFGWLHGAHPFTADVGIVLCSPWGREEVSAHYTLRQWALQLSAQGWPCVRFDYPGEGDSSGDPLIDGGLQAWVEGVRQAMDVLKQRTGVRQVCLLGLRVGATLACLAAQGRDDVIGLAAIAPVVRGRGFVRELTALQAVASKSCESQLPQGVFQSGGYVMSVATLDALSALDLTQQKHAPACHVMVIDRDDMPPSSAWIRVLEAQGAHVEHHALPGYVAMMADPHLAVVPHAMLEACLRWMRRLAAPVAGPLVPQRSALAHAWASACLPAPGLAGAMLTETALRLPGVPAFGVLTQADAGPPTTGHAILLLNAGSTRHIGPSRMSVTLARRWAAAGHVVLRMDLAGLGDSDVRAGCAVNMSYPHDAMVDVRAAVDHLLALPGIKQVHACGLCSGAYHCLKAARDGIPLASITLINPLIYFNAEGLSLDDGADLSPQRVHSAVASYKESAASLEKWRKLVTGKVTFGAVLKVFVARGRMVLSGKAMSLARLLRWPLKDDLGTDLRCVARKGVRVNFIFSQGDPGELMLREQAGSVLHHMQGRRRLGLQVFQGADHVFTDLVVRNEMLMCLTQIISNMTVVA